MRKNTIQINISKLLDLLRKLADKDIELTLVLNEDGIESNSNFSNEHEDIGKRYLSLIGYEGGYLDEELSFLIGIITSLFSSENPHADITEDDISDLIFGCFDEEYNLEKNKLFEKLQNVKRTPGYDELFDFDIANEVAKDSNFEPPRFYNDDIDKWSIESSNIITYDLENNRTALHGILIPEHLFDFFNISSEDIKCTFDDMQDCKKVKLFRRRGVYTCSIIGSGDKALLVWYGLRKKLIRKYQELFPYIERNNSDKFLRMVFDKTHFNSNNYIQIDFELISKDL